MVGIRVQTWDDARTKQEISKRFRNAQDARAWLERKWVQNERQIYAQGGGSESGSDYQGGGVLGAGPSGETTYQSGMPGVDGSDAMSASSYIFKNFRFIHAQMSANPPSIAMKPTTSDQDAHRKADAADRIARWAMRHYRLQERTDQLSLQTLLYGFGAIKTRWDSGIGDILEYDPETEELILEGDISVTVPFTWSLYLDPDAKSTDELKWVIERIYVDYDEALARWPEKEDELKQAKLERRGGPRQGTQTTERQSQLTDNHYNCVELLEYWETGLPTNGYVGRYCITTVEGEVIEPCRPSPYRFRRAGAVSKIEGEQYPDDVKQLLIDKLPEQAELPYHILTDIDQPNSCYGRSFIEYVANLQDNLTRIDSARMDNIEAHAVARLILPETADISDDALSNSPWDVLKVAGGQAPYYMQAPQLMGELTSERQNLIQGINDISGVNESMFGQQSREQSGASMQYATNQGNMVRRRLFNKYVGTVESYYKGLLNLVRKHWSTERTIHVLGKEKALEAIDVKGADIDGGYDVIGEYGTTLSLDPVTRREELITLQPMFEKAGVPARKIMGLMKLNELESAYDSIELAGTRQKEIFDEMIARNVYIPPKPFRDHANMIAWALDYFMTQEFESLPLETQQLCEKHIQDRATLAAQEKAGPVGQDQAAAAPGAGTSAAAGAAVPPPGGAVPSPLGGAPAPAPAAAPATAPGGV